jgi:integrase
MGKDLKGKDLGKGFRQRPDGRYEARAVVKGVNICLYDLNLPKLRKTFEEEKAKVIRCETGNRSKMLLEEWFDEWFDVYKKPNLKSETAIKVYRRKIANTYIRILGKKRIEDISQVNVQEATNELLEGEYSNRSIKEALSVFKSCMDAALLNKMIIFNPCKDILIKKAMVAPKERRVLDHWEQDLYLEVARDGFYHEVFAIMLLSGMRIGEVSGLQWEDVDFEHKCIHIKRGMQTAYIDGEKVERLHPPKTVNSYRNIPFFGNAEELFKKWRKKQVEFRSLSKDKWRANPEFGNLVFTTTLGSPLTRYNIVHEINRIERNMKIIEMTRAIDEHRAPRTIEHIHPHAFRHTFATRCFELGLDPLFVQRIMGHADYSTTTVYTHLLKDSTDNEVKKMSDISL